jgi:N-acyl-D-amino-acid deacylase
LYDLIIKNGTVIDGIKTPAFKADVGIQSDRIDAVGDLSGQTAAHTIDAQDRIVAPGFVDVHNHSDGWLRKIPHLVPKTIQGFTTEVIMADGISYAPVDRHTVHDWLYYMRALNALNYADYSGWNTLSDYMAGLDGCMAQNAITHIPYGNVRSKHWGWQRMAPDDFQMHEMQAEIAKEMEAGAVGVSTGLDYISECFASTDELVQACQVMAPYQGLYVTHVRYKLGTLTGVKEAVEIGRRAQVPVHISHLKATTPEDNAAIIEYIDKTATNEVDFSFDVYPYLPGSTMLNYMLPHDIWEDGPLAVIPKLKDPQFRARFAYSLHNYPLEKIYIAWLPGKENSHFIGQQLITYLDSVNKPPQDALCDLLIEENLAVLLVFHHGDDALVHPYLAHDKYMMGTDGIYFPDGAVHPRMYGSAARVLGPCVRDYKLFSLEEAVYKLSGYPAARFGLKQRGQIKEGYFADLVVFDSATILDKATYQEPHQYSEGVDHVLVNGTPIITDGKAVEKLNAPLPGRSLKFNQ